MTVVMCGSCGRPVKLPGKRIVSEEWAKESHELEAQCAAMRRAVRGALDVADPSDSPEWGEGRWDALEDSLASDAGSRLLRRLEALERVEEAARKLPKAPTRWYPPKVQIELEGALSAAEEAKR